MKVCESFVGGESSGSGGESDGISDKSSIISDGSGGSGRYKDRKIMIRDKNIIFGVIYFSCLCYSVADIFVEE